MAETQALLNQLGYNAGSVDGIPGPQTRDAIRAFQRDRGLPPTGRTSGRLVQALRAETASGRNVRAGTAPAFDCGRAGSPTERAICGSKELSDLDRQLAEAYAAAQASDPGAAVMLRSGQRSWLMRRDACRANVACIADAYRYRLAEISGRTAAAGAAGIVRQGGAATAFTLLNGYDLPQGDYRSGMTDPRLAGVSRMDCQTQCGADERCRAFTYNANARICILKNAVPERVPFAGAISGIKVSKPTSLSMSDSGSGGAPVQPSQSQSDVTAARPTGSMVITVPKARRSTGSPRPRLAQAPPPSQPLAGKEGLVICSRDPDPGSVATLGNMISPPYAASALVGFVRARAKGVFVAHKVPTRDIARIRKILGANVALLDRGVTMHSDGRQYGVLFEKTKIAGSLAYCSLVQAMSVCDKVTSRSDKDILQCRQAAMNASPPKSSSGSLVVSTARAVRADGSTPAPVKPATSAPPQPVRKAPPKRSAANGPSPAGTEGLVLCSVDPDLGSRATPGFVFTPPYAGDVLRRFKADNGVNRMVMRLPTGTIARENISMVPYVALLDRRVTRHSDGKEYGLLIERLKIYQRYPHCALVRPTTVCDKVGDIYPDKAILQCSAGASSASAAKTSSPEPPLPTETEKFSSVPEMSSLDHGKQVELTREAGVVYDYCKSRESFATLTDCRCVAAKLIRKRIAEDVVQLGADQSAIDDAVLSEANRIGPEVCPNRQGVRDSAYGSCMAGYADNAKYCTCYADVYAQAFMNNPTGYVPALTSLGSFALGECDHRGFLRQTK